MAEATTPLTRVVLPGNDRFCATCGVEFVPYHEHADHAQKCRRRTKGHLRSKAKCNGRTARRLWVWQCWRCNHEQRDMSLTEWLAHLAETVDYATRRQRLQSIVERLRRAGWPEDQF